MQKWIFSPTSSLLTLLLQYTQTLHELGPGGIDEGKGSEGEGRPGGGSRAELSWAERWLELLMTVDLHALPWFPGLQMIDYFTATVVPHHTSDPNVNWQPPKPLRLCYWIPGRHRRSVFNYKPHYFHCGLVVWRLESTQNLIALLLRAFRPSCNSVADARNLLPLTQILTPWPLFFSLPFSLSLSIHLCILLLFLSLIRFQWYSTLTMCTLSHLWSPTAMSTSHQGTPHLTYRQTWIPKQVKSNFTIIFLQQAWDKITLMSLWACWRCHDELAKKEVLVDKITGAALLR